MIASSQLQQPLPPVQRAPRGVAVALFALATFGAHLSYAPLLALLLPRRIVAIDPQHAAMVSSLIMLAGAFTASGAHILAGRISDRWRRRHGSRRGPIAAGLVLTVAALLATGVARDLRIVAIGLIAVQFSLNLMFAPLGALLVDYFPDQTKARGAAFANLTIPLAGIGTGAVALMFPRDGPWPFVAVAIGVAISIAPLLLLWPFADGPAPARVPGIAAGHPPAAARRWSHDLALAGLARLLVQCGAAFMVTYFYLYLVQQSARSGPASPGSVDQLYGRLVLATTGAVMLVTVIAGLWSDRTQRRRTPMIVAALVAGMALGTVALGSAGAAGGWSAMAGYAVFQTGLIAYLALDAALVATLLTRDDRAGEMLGYMNLANTLPSIVVPALVLALSRGAADLRLGPGFALTALCCLAAGGLVRKIRAVE